MFSIFFRVILQLQAILQYFTSCWCIQLFIGFYLGLLLISLLSFTNNYSSHQQFVKNFVKKFVFLTLLFLKKNLNIKSNVTVTNYFITFLQTIDVANSYWFSFEPTTNIIFLLINNHSPYQQFVKNIVKQFVSLAFSKYDNYDNY